MSLNSPSHIIVGMSGGVDSSVTAYVLKEQGFNVTGLFMKNWEEDDTEEYCSAAQDRNDAEAVCERLGIPFKTINFAAEYWDRVFEHFLAEYKAGRTPNPDILCNREIKFKAFLDYALSLNAAGIATGHYARIRLLDGHYQLLRGVDPDKDQSYFLYALDQAALSKSQFPIGALCKREVRAIAQQQGFHNHAKKDSTGICFIGERRFNDFLQRYLPAQPGPIVSDKGITLGEHQGLMYYTIGQRKGIGIGGRDDSIEAAWYVIEKDLSSNTLIVGQGSEHPRLFYQTLRAEQMHWIAGHAPSLLFSCTAKIRYRQKDTACTITAVDDTCYQVTFAELQRAVTPGQSIVFYDGEVCLGGGIIS